jgi:hypothetical protein
MAQLLGGTYSAKGAPGPGAKAPPKSAASPKEDAKRKRKEEKARRKAEAKARKKREKELKAGGATGAAAAGAGTARAETAGEPAGAAARPVGAGARSPSTGPLTLAILVAIAAVSSTRSALPRPVPANASDTLFSSARAMSTLVEIAREPHPTGSPEHALVRDYLANRLRGLGLEPEVQTTTSMLEREDRVRVATVRNVIARLPGTASTGAVLLTAHYDTRELSPGAGDDGTGVAAILEALRALRMSGPLRNDVIVLLTDAEELGLLGARAFVDRHPWMGDVAVVLSFEMRGAGGPAIMFETNANNGWIIRALQEFDPRPFANSLAAEVYERMPNDTDFTAFKEAGKQGLNFAAIGNPRVYHQATDTPEALSEATLQHHGMRALAALRHLGQADLRAVDAPDAVYFTLPLVGLVVYDAAWVLPVTGGLAALLLLVGLLARRAKARLAGLVAAVGVAILGAALSWGAARALLSWADRFHPEAGALAGSLYHHEGWYIVALVAAVLAIVTALHGVARRWLSGLELVLGATLVPFGLAVWTTFTAPLAAMNVQWPVAAALASGLLLALLPSASRGMVGWLALLLLTVPALAFLVPLAELLWLSLTFRALGFVAVVAAVALHLSLPAIDALRHPNGWWAPLTAVAACAGALWLGTSSADADPDSPAPSTLVYAYEHGTSTAFWVTDPDADLVLDAEAIAWAEARAGAPFAATLDMTPFGLTWDAAPVAVAGVAEVAPPEIVILSDSVDGGARRVRLGARSRIGAERLTFLREAGSRTRILAIGGTPVERPGSVTAFDHWGVPDSLVVLELDMPAGEAIGLHVVEGHLRPALILGAGAFARPASLAPDVSTGSDRALFRYSVAAWADPRQAQAPPSTAAPADGSR